MDKYYINKNQQENGDHEVHLEGCSYFPNQENAVYLGLFDGCASAVACAKRQYTRAQINGCYFCVRSCHTS